MLYVYLYFIKPIYSILYYQSHNYNQISGCISILLDKTTARVDELLYTLSLLCWYACASMRAHFDTRFNLYMYEEKIYQRIHTHSLCVMLIYISRKAARRSTTGECQSSYKFNDMRARDSRTTVFEWFYLIKSNY